MKVINKRSSVVLDNRPKLPSVDQIEYGEIAINFADGYETMSILNSNSGIVSFSADHIIESKIPSISALSASVVTVEETTGNAVVSGSFDSSYNIVLNKANNTDINIPISGMLSGYQKRIDARNKLSADYIMDGQLNGYYTIDERKKLGKLITTVATSANSGYMTSDMVVKLDAIPNISVSDSGKVLQVSSAGTWTLVVPNVIYVGVDIPSDQLGNNGDVYIQTS